MKKRQYLLFFVWLLSLACTTKTNYSSGESLKLQDAYTNFPVTKIKPKHKVMVLGTFHFNRASDRSSVKGKNEMDIFSENNQLQLKKLIMILKDFKPTKIAIEFKPESQGKIDSLYHQYRIGRYELKADEAFQLGFKLAKLMNHETVYCVDNWTPLPETAFTAGNWKKYADSMGHTKLWHAYDAENKRFNSYMDALKTQLNAFDLIRLYNTKMYGKRGKQTWATGLVNLGHGDLYVGADLRGRWYKRNTRIYVNIINLPEKNENENILIIYGAAHKYVLDELFESNPEYKLIQLEELIRGDEK